MVPETYYEILGIAPDATHAEIKEAFRQLVKAWHPDINHSEHAHEMMQKINEAYGVLGDDQTRAEYDYWLNDISHSFIYTDSQTTATEHDSQYTSSSPSSTSSDKDSFHWYYGWVAAMVVMNLIRACS